MATFAFLPTCTSLPAWHSVAGTSQSRLSETMDGGSLVGRKNSSLLVGSRIAMVGLVVDWGGVIIWVQYGFR